MRMTDRLLKSANGRYADARREEPWPSRRAALSKLEGRLRVGFSRPPRAEAVIRVANPGRLGTDVSCTPNS